MRRQFLSHRRRGLNVALTTGRRASVTMLTTQDAESVRVTAPLDLVGPGDVAGLDGAAISRRWPDPGAVDIVAGKVAWAEFERDDLPWLLGPSGRARAWLALVVIEDDGETTYAADREPLAVLTVAPDRLPPAGTADAMAHVEVLPDGRSIARLLSARRLEPGLAWRAALVPAFAGGVAAGLGQDPPADPFAPAWDGAGQVTLPVYASWTFRTGTTPGFEDIVKDLKPAVVDTGIAGVPMAGATAARLGLDTGSPARTVLLRSALHARTGDLPRLSDPVDLTLRETFRVQAARLSPVLDQADAIVPPRYGAHHAGRGTGEWIDDLNRDMGLRLAAGYGAEIVRRRQDDLVRRVWDFAGPIEEANRIVQDAAIGARAARRTHRALTALADAAPGAALGILSTAADRVRRVDGTVFARHPEAALATPTGRRAVRRAARARIGASAMGTTEAVMTAAQVNAEAFAPAGQPHLPDPAATPRGIVARTPEEARDALERFDALDGDIPVRRPEREDEVGLGIVFDAPRAGDPMDRPVPTDDIGALERDLLAAVDPDVAIEGRVRARVPLGAGLRTIRVEPRLDLALLESLADLSPAHVAPALETLDRNRLTALRLDRPFCEALMVGANHELMRELMWRGYPGRTDMTPLRRIFPQQHVEGEPEVEADTAPILTWAGSLGDHLDAAAASVLLMRTDLLKLFPETAVFLWPARWEGGMRVLDRPAPGRAKFPVTRGALPPDATYLGYDISLEEMRGPASGPTGARAGWFLVFHGPEAMDAFGFDAPRGSGEPRILRGWGDLSWSDVGDGDAPRFVDPTKLAGLALDPRGPNEPTPDPPPAPLGTSAHVAAVMADRALTVALHLSDVVPGP